MGSRIAVAGATGQMGKMVIKVLRESEDLRLSGALVRHGSPFVGQSATDFLGWETEVLFEDDVDRVLSDADCLIELSSPGAVGGHVSACMRHGVPVVIGTTGLSQQLQAVIEDAATRIAIVQSANLSPAMTAVNEFLAKAAALFPEYDVHIAEAHHRHKKDAPSGTALWMAESVKRARLESGCGADSHISFTSIRGGNIVSEHTAMLFGDVEQLEIKHVCTDREVYASGSLHAARFAIGQTPGLYSMKEVVAARR
ncbi:dihydrodipicolinate reductase [Paraburkholderia susongensis]|uniref:4-hydroxy-tetrahydrodipicolinate reductase n=2 Tax=Paraburkholderia susongensis TaxID=1515439 RepID=A0A1X7LR26_9BURK|nr:4-hydroxy-tetrahydrodipicolinate reductase [Paraburkholderia susongensis]SMG55579.1 dihydrodipicolinate reductase [Paraburkholderia susongensis]